MPDFAAWRDEAQAVIDDVNDGAPDVDERAGLWAYRYRLLFAAGQQPVAAEGARMSPEEYALWMADRARIAALEAAIAAHREEKYGPGDPVVREAEDIELYVTLQACEMSK